jgi:hypothetical protein
LFFLNRLGYNQSMSKKPIPDAVREYMSELGSKRTPAKLEATRKNAALGAAARRKDPLDLPCTCGQCPDTPKTTCPRGRLLRQRARQAANRSVTE